jgi:hypothetical protein
MRLVSGFVLDFLSIFGVGNVFVANFYLCLGSVHVDDAGVVELVGRMKSSLPECWNCAGVRGEARLKDDAGFEPLKGGDLFFETPYGYASCRRWCGRRRNLLRIFVAAMAASLSLG